MSFVQISISFADRQVFSSAQKGFTNTSQTLSADLSIGFYQSTADTDSHSLPNRWICWVCWVCSANPFTLQIE